ncbi:hypothetical protein HUT16_15445 [Kitasatospora sp. NA04385]|uniref:hypothetical protein n=1 Tax=Kitasatospora sp. NA04385 TaxID=2742135 RepID=UPI0015901910|nr:hypothetical protein [Kitasatospora sp. NA04385]QKW20275.1 hypothetical protein HUT16_15445 [Kitasatospora sp. NA04385]
MTDAITEAYNRECLAPDSRLLGVTGRMRLPEKLAAAHGAGSLPRPLFLAEREIREFTDDLRGFFGLLTTLPQRLFDGSTDAYAAAVGISPRRAALMKRLGVAPVLHGRADLHHDGTSFKLLEFNVGTHLGGTDRAELMRLHLEDEAFRAFAEEHRLDYAHTGEQIVEVLRRLGEQVTGGAEPVVAFVEADGGLAPYLHLVLSFQEMAARLGLRVLLAEIGQVTSKDDKLYLDGTPIDVVLRYFSVNQLCADGRDGAEAEPFFRAHEAGKTLLYTPLDGLLFEQKTSLALLSDPRWRAAYSAEEAELIDRLLPWTRLLTAGESTAGGERVDLLDHCREHRADLLLKPGNQDGGRGIVAGWTVDDRAWREALDAGRGRGWMVQRRVVPRAEPMVDPDTRELRDWHATWGMFVTPHGYGGFHIRALPAENGGILWHGASGQVRKTGVFHYREDREDPAAPQAPQAPVAGGEAR